MIKVLIIEDEPLVAKDLENQIKKNFTDLQVLEIVQSVNQGINWLKSNNPDLIFADIQLADGSSFEIFEKIKPTCPIIFTTAYDEYAIKAFRLNSVDYLLKPVDKEELQRSVGKFKDIWMHKQKDFLTEKLQELITDIKAGDSGRKHKNRFTGHQGKSVVAVKESEVGWFQKDVLIFLVTLDNRKIVTDYHSLEELEDVTDSALFFRANRQYIVSLNAVKGFQSHFTGKVILEPQEPLQDDITVSREKAGEFKRWFEG